jgi:hypothetical protein
MMDSSIRGADRRDQQLLPLSLCAWRLAFQVVFDMAERGYDGDLACFRPGACSADAVGNRGEDHQASISERYFFRCTGIFVRAPG